MIVEARGIEPLTRCFVSKSDRESVGSHLPFVLILLFYHLVKVKSNFPKIPRVELIMLRTALPP